MSDDSPSPTEATPPAWGELSLWDLLGEAGAAGRAEAEKTAMAAKAAHLDPVGWHYLQVLAQRTHSQTGPAQALLQGKLRAAVAQWQAKMQAHQPPASLPVRPAPSPLAALLHDMAAPSNERPLNPSGAGRMDNTRVAQFRQQLGKIRVQKQVSLAIAHAPQNAGPINSHMLVLRSLGLMRDLSPDYLNRFMGYVESLLVMEDAGRGKAVGKKSATSSKRTT